MEAGECEAQGFVRPIAVDLSSDSFQVREVFIGAPGKDGPGVSIPDEQHEYSLRFGVCRNRRDPQGGNYHCGEVDWYKSKVFIDPAESEQVEVPSPPAMVCGQ